MKQIVFTLLYIRNKHEDKILAIYLWLTSELVTTSGHENKGVKENTKEIMQKIKYVVLQKTIEEETPN